MMFQVTHPEFSFGTTTTVTVAESAASGDVVYTLTVSDDDPGDTLLVKTTFTNSPYFTLDEANCELRLTL